jgi:hypothetical protein
MLAASVCAFEDVAVERAGKAGRGLAGVRARGDPLADERREAQRRELEGVALGQG